MDLSRHSFPNNKYKFDTYKVTSRHPISINTNNYTAVKHQGISNYNVKKDYTLESKSIIDSLNLSVGKNNYIYVEEMPDSNVIYYDSNLRKYRTFSAKIKNQSYETKTFNLTNSQNILKSKFNDKYNINNQNQNNKYNNKTFNFDKNQSQIGNYRNTNSTKNSNVDNNLNKTNVVNEHNTSSRNYNQNKKYNTYNNQEEQNKNDKNYNQININRNANKTIENNKNQTSNINQMNQGRRRESEQNKQLIPNKTQNDQEKNEHQISYRIPHPYQKTKNNQDEIINNNNKRKNAISNDKNDKNINSTNKSTSLNKTSNYAINQTQTPNKRSIKNDYLKDNEIQDLKQIDLEQIKKNMQSPYKAEEILKNENGEIVQRKEEKTIVILSGQKIEPKSVIETFEKPIIDIIQNEDGTSQSIIKQTKITTNVENIPIQNPKEGNLQLVKQIITHEYTTISANKDKFEKNEINNLNEIKKEKEDLNEEKNNLENNEKNNLENNEKNDLENNENNNLEKNEKNNLENKRIDEDIERKDNLLDKKDNENKNNIKSEIKGKKNILEKKDVKNKKDKKDILEKKDSKNKGDKKDILGKKDSKNKEDKKEILEKKDSKNKEEKTDISVKKDSKNKEDNINENKEKNLRYMDIIENEKQKKDNLIKKNKVIVGNNKFDVKKNIQNKSDITGDFQKKKDKDNEIKQKSNKESTNIGKIETKKEENSIKLKNIKTGLTEEKTSTKKEKEKAKSPFESKLKEKSGNELSKNKQDLSKTKDKNSNEEKFLPYSKKELNSSIKKGKTNEETNLRKSFRKNKNEEKDTIKSNISGNIKIVSDLYEKCFKTGNKINSEKDVAKIVEILVSFDEKERKELLAKLLKSFPKSSELNQKILNLIIQKKNITDDNKKIKGKKEENKISLEKNIQKENRSKSQMKAGDKKNINIEEDTQIKSGIKKNKINIEEGIAKTEIIKKIKLEGNEEKTHLRLSEKYGGENYSLNRLNRYSINVPNIVNLNFDGLFLDISKYQNFERYKNPFEGPSSFYKFYRMRQSKIKKKIEDMTNKAKNN